MVIRPNSPMHHLICLLLRELHEYASVFSSEWTLPPELWRRKLDPVFEAFLCT